MKEKRDCLDDISGGSSEKQGRLQKITATLSSLKRYKNKSVFHKCIQLMIENLINIDYNC